MSYIVPREKPKCYNCPFRTLDYCGLLIEHDCVTVNVNEMTVSEYCPLAEIHTPHGRLIDADEFKNYCQTGLENVKPLFKTEKYCKLAIDITQGIIADIDEMETIIEEDKAESEGNNGRYRVDS